ncbi:MULTISPECIES: 16S rRNA (guanine(527)-N(7))-methyltransferase RsmG [Brachybacterium]|uniref:Ribosomal RNA small subunit methyltransferase G n=2 Tax=Brachybacterium TaxID=43668 RepID=A0A3R8RZH6_9MICO|nr:MULTISPECIES: 16S rRNA (guanine(527)-N(7))-methyltransferase RsmG [Brachybacterium]RRR19326.1 16S rRNA (guanine(527)-N(7))-methyltransferase RsmG [Brachybacterium paraconglomeratum]GLI29653.1 ribosomal RNA small subunit methyltransferase G [Brachybacterium conglomeratum]GLK05479.1 ribosomal RNA small subunit methyltransferase G [Brachybacterium conglomeratum]
MTTLPASLRPLAERLFGDRLELAERFAALLAEQGPERGLIGPREVERLWERHLLNCALMADAIDSSVRTLADVGSGAGLPGVVIAIARPELQVMLIETMQRRTTWLEEVDAELGLGLEVVRARAEELHGEREFEVVTARAVAALDKLARWTLPLVEEEGLLLAMKGSSAADEIERAQKVLTKLGGIDPTITRYGMGEVEVPTTVVQVRRRPKASRKGDARG